MTNEPDPSEPATPVPQTPARRSSAKRAWRRLALAGRPRATRANGLAALLAIALGFAIAVQFRQTSDEGLDGLREDELVQILANVNQDNTRLAEEVASLQATRDRLANSGDDAEAALAAQQRIDALGVLAGTVGAQGPGIVLTVSAPSGKYTAAMMLDAIQELRDAGAEAIQVGNVRVVASTYFTQVGEGIAVDGQAVDAPYAILAIGDSKTLASAMAIPGGVIDNAARVGGNADVAQVDSVSITALHVVSAPRYARPVAPETPSP